MNYYDWAQEYIISAQNTKASIDKLKDKAKLEQCMEDKKLIFAEILKLRTIYYELRLTAEHLLNRADAYNQYESEVLDIAV